MNFLTAQEQKVLFVVLVLLVVGMAVKTWQATGPAESGGEAKLKRGMAPNE